MMIPSYFLEVTNKNLLLAHGAAFLWGIVPILGKLTSMPPVPLTWYRVAIAIVTLFLYFKLLDKGRLDVKKVDYPIIFRFTLVGMLVGLYWVLFFLSIEWSNTSIGSICIPFSTLFTAFLEPLFKKKRILKLDILAGVLIIIGIAVIFKAETQYSASILLGVICAFISSIVNTINSQFVQKRDPIIISFYEFVGAFLLVSIYCLFTGNLFYEFTSLTRLFYLFVLGSICTAFVYIIHVFVTRTLSVFVVSLVTNLVPIYGIVLSCVLFNDHKVLTVKFWIGSLIVLTTVFFYPILRRKACREKINFEVCGG